MASQEIHVYPHRLGITHTPVTSSERHGTCPCSPKGCGSIRHYSTKVRKKAKFQQSGNEKLSSGLQLDGQEMKNTDSRGGRQSDRERSRPLETPANGKEEPGRAKLQREGGTPRSGRGHRAQAAPPPAWQLRPTEQNPHQRPQIHPRAETQPFQGRGLGNKLRVHPKHASNVSRGPRRARGCSDDFDRAPGSSARAPTAPGPFPPTL